MTGVDRSDAEPPAIDWHMSAALENVARGGDELPEVTNLERAVRAWRDGAAELKAAAVLTLEHPVRLDAAMPLDRFEGAAIGRLAALLPDRG